MNNPKSRVSGFEAKAWRAGGLKSMTVYNHSAMHAPQWDLYLLTSVNFKLIPPIPNTSFGIWKKNVQKVNNSINMEGTYR
jgi:hypothetical protein